MKKISFIPMVAILVIVALMVGILVMLVPQSAMSLDVSKAKNYTLSNATKDFLVSIDEKVTLYVLYSSDDTANDMQYEYFLKRLVSYGKNIELKFIKIDDSAELMSKIGVDKNSASHYMTIAVSDKRSEYIGYSNMFFYEVKNSTLNSMGLSKLSVSDYYKYANLFSQSNDYAEYLNSLLSDSIMYFQGESMLCAMLEYVTADIIPDEYALVGHGETIMEGSTFTRCDISAVGAIPENASVVYVFAPTSDYSTDNIQVMKSYLDRGGEMVFVTNEDNLSMPNLMSLINSYGLSATAGAVGEEITVISDSDLPEDSVKDITYTVDVAVNTDHDALADLAKQNTLAPAITDGNEILFGENGDSSLLLTPLLTTSENAFIGNDTANKAKRTLAAAAENSVGAKLVWFTGAESFLNMESENTALLDNNYCLYCVMSWSDMVYRSSLELQEVKEYSSQSTSASDSTIGMFIVVAVIVVPISIVSIGAVRTYTRKKQTEK